MGAEHLKTGQRAGKFEREAVREALKTIWETAGASEDEVRFTFPATQAGKKECRSLYDGLFSFRRSVSKRRLEERNYQLWLVIDSLSLCKAPDDTAVWFRRKAGIATGRSLVILSAAERLKAGQANGHGYGYECGLVRPEHLEG